MLTYYRQYEDPIRSIQRKPEEAGRQVATGGGEEAGSYSGGGAVRGVPSPLRDSGGGGLPPLDFHNLKRKSTVTHHSNRKRVKEEEGLWNKKKYMVSGVMIA